MSGAGHIVDRYVSPFLGILPLIAWLSLFSLTITLFYYGPFDWRVTNGLQLNLYLTGVGLAVTVEIGRAHV